MTKKKLIKEIKKEILISIKFKKYISPSEEYSSGYLEVGHNWELSQVRWYDKITLCDSTLYMISEEPYCKIKKTKRKLVNFPKEDIESLYWSIFAINSKKEKNG